MCTALRPESRKQRSSCAEISLTENGCVFIRMQLRGTQNVSSIPSFIYNKIHSFVRGTTVSAEHVAAESESLNLKKFIYELDVPVIVGGVATTTGALHLMRAGAAGVHSLV